MVVVIALLLAVPLGLGAAMYLSEYASPRARRWLKPTVELLAGIPSVVYGFFALKFVTPTLLQDILALEVNFTNSLAAGLVLGVMVLPTIASLAEDAMSAVPQSIRQGSLAMGANRMQTTLRVVFPAALSGIAAAIVLGMSRAAGETMIVALAAGAQKVWSGDVFEGHQAMTGYIAQTFVGENPVGSTPYNMPFAVALTAVRHDTDPERDQHVVRPSIQAGLLMSTATATAAGRHRQHADERQEQGPQRRLDRLPVALWFSLFFGVMVLLALIIDTAIEGAPRSTRS